MTIEIAALLGAWVFAASTAIAKEVSGTVMLIAWALAVSLTMFLL